MYLINFPFLPWLPGSEMFFSMLLCAPRGTFSPGNILDWKKEVPGNRPLRPRPSPNSTFSAFLAMENSAALPLFPLLPRVFTLDQFPDRPVLPRTVAPFPKSFFVEKLSSSSLSVFLKYFAAAHCSRGSSRNLPPLRVNHPSWAAAFLSSGIFEATLIFWRGQRLRRTLSASLRRIHWREKLGPPTHISTSRTPSIDLRILAFHYHKTFGNDHEAGGKRSP